MHVEGARIEAAYRSLFYRGRPPYPLVPLPNGPAPTLSAAPTDSDAAPAPREAGAGSSALAVGGAENAAPREGRRKSNEGEQVVERGHASKGERIPRHEYDIVVCHGNVIRYFALRALQLPPEAWLRLCTYNCSLTHIKVRPSGTVSLISLGDTGHLRLDESSFSMHEGYEW